MTFSAVLRGFTGETGTSKTSLRQPSLLALIILFSTPVFARTYYVSTTGSDANPGTFSQPWLSIQHAADTATAGATVYVLGGVYKESIRFRHSGTASAPITFESYPGQTAIIDGTGLAPSGVQGLINIVNRSYITISGFDIRNYTTSSNKPTPAGIWITGHGAGDRILGNRVHNITTTARRGNAFGISVYGTSQTPITRLVIDGNEVYDLKTGESESVDVDGNVTQFRITNNLVHDDNNIGIDAIGYEGVGPVGYDEARYGTVSGNTIYNISGITNPGEGKSYDADGLYCDGCAHVVWERNVVFQDDYGIETTSENQVCLKNGTEWTGGKAGDGSAATGTYPCYGRFATVRNNLFYDENSTGASIGGYSQESGGGGQSNGGGGSYHDVFVNNTLYNDGTQPGNASEGTPSGEFQIQYQVGRDQGDYFENNIVYAGSPDLWINSFASCSSTYPCPPATLDWNLWYSDAGYEQGTSIYWANASNYASFAAYQSATGEDANSRDLNPLFYDRSATPPDFDPSRSSPAADAGGTRLTCAAFYCGSGTSIYGRTDLLGDPRMTNGQINVGAYQSTALSNTLNVHLTAGTYMLAPGRSTTLQVEVSASPGGAGVPSGTVKFMLGSTVLATQTVMPTSAATSVASLPISASQLATGANTLTAIYSGNSIAPCCNRSEPPGGGTPVPVYPRTTSQPITIAVSPRSGLAQPPLHDRDEAGSGDDPSRRPGSGASAREASFRGGGGREDGDQGREHLSD